MLQPSSIEFIIELRENNNREWFHAQKKRYDKVKADYQRLVSALLGEMKKADETLAPLVEKNCTFRIARDIRFSQDKTPYKTHFGVGMSTHGRRSGMAEYYVHLEPGGKGFAGGGIYMPSSEQLKKIRREIDVFGDDLVAIIEDKAFKRHYQDLDRNIVLTRPPKGYSAEHPHLENLKLKSYTAVTPLPDELFTSPELVGVVVERLTALKPFLHFLNRGLNAEEDEW
jgi:uncharacterized protein (TIGR02453 family)